ncbi:MAG: RagB/SusD family nutrient uptake outer membrane protein [Rikenellaceae bacterium]|nr:RagB/SusD family nutrient uptake outer membrane protein [Rikenellaceae bacterium]
MIKYFLAGCSVLMCTACNNFLKEVSADEFEPKTTETFRELLNGEGYCFSIALDPLTNFLSDDIDGHVPSMTLSSAQTAYRDLFSWQSGFYRTFEDADVPEKDFMLYQYFYQYIMAANIIIENLEDSLGTQEEKDIVMAEALSLRAFYYFYLVNLFALPYNDPQTDPHTNPGVVLTLKSEILDEGKPRNTVAQAYERIVEDIETAISLFSNDKKDRGWHRISYTGACHIASWIFLYMENWEKAVHYASLTLERAPELVYLPDYVIDNIYSPTNGPLSRTFPETIFNCGTGAATLNFITVVSLSSDLTALFDENDSRLDKYFMSPSWAVYQQELKTGGGSGNICWRTSELYLNRAEAYIHLYQQGNGAAMQGALEDLNHFCAHRYIDYTPRNSGSADELKAWCREERRKEFFLECHRWFDLRRYGMPSLEHTWIDQNAASSTRFTLLERDPFYVLPIPDQALQNNPYLEQNPLASAREGIAL